MVQRLVANWSPTTIRQTRSVLNRQSPNPGRFKPLLGDIRVNKLTTIDIDDMYRLLSRCGGHDGRPLTSGTVHRVHVVLHRALTQAVRWEWIWFNPAANSSPPRVTPAEIRPPTPATKPDARFAMGRHRSHPLSERVQPRPGGGCQPHVGGEVEVGLFDRCDKALNLVWAQIATQPTTSQHSSTANDNTTAGSRGRRSCR